MGEQSGPGFGPTEPVTPGAAPFSVTGPTAVALDGQRTGTASFVVTNVTGRPVRARLLPQALSGADAGWLSVVGEAERPIGVAATVTVDVRVHVPPKATAGQHALRLDVSAEDRPDLVATGQVVSFTVPEPDGRKFPTWVIAVVLVAILLIGGGAYAITRFVGGPDPEASPTPTPTPTPTPVAPVASAPPTLTGDAVVGGTLEVVEGSWDVPVTRFWVWQTCPADAADEDPQGCTDLVSEVDGTTATATGPTHVVTAAEEGTRLRVVETAFAGASDVDLTERPVTSQPSAPTAAVAPAPPEPVAVQDVRGRPLSEASDVLGSLGFSVLVTQLDVAPDCDPVVEAQAPASGTLPPGSSVALTTKRPPTSCYIRDDWVIGGGYVELPEFLDDLARIGP